MLGDPNDYAFQFSVTQTYTTPAAITSLTLGHPFHLYAGSQDGSLRVYDLSTQKVIKAIRALEGEVSSIICMKKPRSEFRDAWIAHGHRDAVNELALHYNKTHLGMGTDAGNVVLVDLESYAISKPKTKHSNICGSEGTSFSAGFDHTFLHHDFVTGDLVSQAAVPPRPTTDSNATMTPPFITSFAISSTGVVAAGTACGLLWIGIGGEKRPDQKKTKKWQGLDPNECAAVAAAQGPIASIEEDRQILLKMLWQGTTQNMEKVNKVIADDKRIIVGGLTKKGKGNYRSLEQIPEPTKSQRVESVLEVLKVSKEWVHW
ncbi:hypothetical protein BKA70DRAFT_1375720 [Coprinopsis sp. MPI-PUGE-AT-0042]|nr:hypothetical protein BKA70DRAFT_1375720 [Coprinopsis sp. MPI-PUGE-AT-0042]